MMKTTIILISLVLFSILTNCNNKETEVAPEIKAPIIYGYHLKDVSGNLLDAVGAPQIRKG